MCSFWQFKLASEYCTWVGFNSRWGSILSIFVFGWGSNDILIGWGCNQDWGFNRADTVINFFESITQAAVFSKFIIQIIILVKGPGTARNLSAGRPYAGKLNIGSSNSAALNCAVLDIVWLQIIKVSKFLNIVWIFNMLCNFLCKIGDILVKSISAQILWFFE